VTERLRARLDALDRAQQVALVLRLVDASPDLADLVHLPLPGETQPLDTRPLSSRVTTILRTMGDDWRASYRAQFELDPLVAVAQERLSAGALDDARRAFRAIIDAILACYIQLRDEESEIANIVRDCVSGLGRALDATPLPAERAQVLRDLFDVFAWDRIQHGGYGMSEPVEELLVHHTTADEKGKVLAWLHAARPAGDTQRSRWGRRAAGELCLALMGDDPEPDAVATVLQWAGLTRRYIQHLLVADRKDDAVRALARASDDPCGGADLLVEAGLRDEAVRVLTSHPRLLDEEGRSIPAWLERHGQDASGVEELARQVGRFRRHPTIGVWDQIRAEAENHGVWAIAAPRLLGAVDDARVAVQPVRARALAAVGRLDEAMQVWSTLNESAKTTCGLAIARDAARSRPELARSLLRFAIDRLAGRKSRAVKEERERLERELAALPAP
jgi:hypothetical protein